MFNRFAALLAVLPLVAVGVWAQGLDTKASKDDWEEINFEFNSSVLVDGYPSLLRVAELLQKHPGFKVRVEGHTDIIGGGQYNEKLGQARADAVRDFLVKYGASAGQISTGTRGKADPKYPGQKPTFTKTDEARWMNRRVVLTVMDTAEYGPRFFGQDYAQTMGAWIDQNYGLVRVLGLGSFRGAKFGMILLHRK